MKQELKEIEEKGKTSGDKLTPTIWILEPEIKPEFTNLACQYMGSFKKGPGAEFRMYCILKDGTTINVLKNLVHEFEGKNLVLVGSETISEFTDLACLYMGSFRRGPQNKYVFVGIEEPGAEFSAYRNLGDQTTINVLTSLVSEFKNRNTVIVPEEYSNNFSYEEEFLKIQREFKNISEEKSPAEAVAYLRRTYKP